MRIKPEAEQKLTGFWQRMWRKQLILPAEHGSWSWLLVPFFVGAAVTREMSLGVWLTFLGGFAVFLMRQPATVWLRVRRGRGRRRDAAPAAAWLVLLSVTALGSLLWLMLLGRAVLLWLLLPLTAVLILYILSSRRGSTGLRTLWMELAGAVVLAEMAPAALVAAEGVLSLRAWMLWLLMGLQNVLGVFYVRLRIADTHKRPFPRKNIVWWHVVGLLIVVPAAVWATVPPGVIVPYVGLLLRAVWSALRERPIPNIKRFGFTEVGVEIAGGLWIVAMYWWWGI